MSVLVTYDSRFGGTKQIAEAIADALRPAGRERLTPVTANKLGPDDLELVVVGGPTERHGVTLPLRVIFDEIPPNALRRVAGAAFDTRLRMPALLSGSAAKVIAKRLRRAGANLLLSPKSFVVRQSDRRLQEGEVDRARAWASQILQAPRGLPRTPLADRAPRVPAGLRVRTFAGELTGQAALPP